MQHNFMTSFGGCKVAANWKVSPVHAKRCKCVIQSGLIYIERYFGLQHWTSYSHEKANLSQSSSNDFASRSMLPARKPGVLASSNEKTSQSMCRDWEDGNGPVEVYENQRWFGFSWSAPIAALDCPKWSTEDGTSISHRGVEIMIENMETSVASRLEGGWYVVVDSGTDAEGWQYGTVFKHLQFKRAGGRASQRFGDTVRRRKWKRVEKDQMQGDQVTRDHKQEKAFQSRHDAEGRSRAIRSFMNILIDLFSRRKFWQLVPWDPSVVFILSQKHKEEYATLRNKTIPQQIFSPEKVAPMSILHEQGTLLQDLICSAIHSRAAYGFAMQAGHIKSVSSYIRLHTLQPLTFDAVAGVSHEANNEAICALTGVEDEDIFVANWRNSPYRPCYYVAADKANKCIVISIRGSLEIGDLLSDVTAHPLKVELMGVDGWVHQGIMAAATYIHCCTKDALDAAAEKYPGWPILVTGHSLGGGVAAILSMLMIQCGGLSNLGRIRCVGIGPAAVMSSSLASACDSIAISLILGSDPVPHLSYASVERLLLEMSSLSPVKRAAEDIGKRISQLIGITKTPDTISTEPVEATKWKPLDDARIDNQSQGLTEVTEHLTDFDFEGSGGHKEKELEIIDFNKISTKLTNRDHPRILRDEPAMEKDVTVLEYVPEADGTLISSALASTGQKDKNQNRDKSDTNEMMLGDPEVLYPPGKLLWILKDEGDSSTEAQMSPTADEHGDNSLISAAVADLPNNIETKAHGSERKPSVVVEAHRETFERILFMPAMLDDHLPDRYLDALNEL
eukprot:jgi/Picsp_1/2430/NSC_05890-R1_alpha beta-hydrolase